MSLFTTTPISTGTGLYSTTTTSILPNTTEFIIIVDPKCKSYYSNSSGVVIKSYEGIPENLVVNLVVWICLLVLYTFLRKIGDYGRFGLVKTGEERSYDSMSERVRLKRNRRLHQTTAGLLSSWTTNLFKKHQKSDDSQMIITDSDGDQQHPQQNVAATGTSSQQQQQAASEISQHQDPQTSSSNPELGLAENSVASTSSTSSSTEESGTSNTRIMRTGSTISNSHEAYHSSYYKDKYFFSWIINLIKLKDKHINEKCGKDAIYYLVFQRYLIVYIIFVTVVSLAVILPINLYGKALNDNSLFGSTTIVNIYPTSSVLWVHCIISWLFLVVGIIMMRQFSKRMEYSEADYVSRTVLITNYPILWCKKDLIHKHFREAYPDLVITDLQFVYDTKKLFKLDRRRHAMHVGRITSEKMLEKTGLRPLMHPYHCGSMFELCCCCCAKYYQEGSLADSIDYYTKNENEVVERMRELRERTLKKPLNIIFLTFQNQNMAAAFLKDYRLGVVLGSVVHGTCSRRGRCNACYLCKDYPKKSELSDTLTTDRWHVKYAPSPSNIKWENMSNIGLLWWLQVILINIVLFILMMFFTTPSILLDKLNELGNATTISTQSLENYFPSYIAEFLPSIILRLVAALLPVIVAQTALLERHWTRSAENKSMMGKTYILLLFMILILPTLGLTSINALLEFKTNDSNVKWTCVSDNGAFFVKYIITFSFIGTALDLLRLPDLFMYIIRMIWSRSSAERLAVRMQAAFEFDYGVQYAWVLSLFTVMISYSVVCPLIMPFGLIYLVLKHTVDRYNIYFGFTATKVDKQIHKTAVSFMIAALLLLQLSILFFIALRNQGNINTNAMTTIQIIILSFSLFIYLGRIFFGIFKRFSPFKYKQTKLEEYSPYDALSGSNRGINSTNNSSSSSSNVVTSPPRTSQPDYDSEPINIDGGSSESRKKLNRELKAKKLSKRNNVQSPFLPHVLQAEYEVPMNPLHKSMSMTNYGSKKTGSPMKRSSTEPLHLNVPNPELSIRNPAFVHDEDTDDQLLDTPNVILNENQIKLDINSELDFKPMSTTIFDQINEERGIGPAVIAEENDDILINIDHKPGDQNA